MSNSSFNTSVHPTQTSVVVPPAQTAGFFSYLSTGTTNTAGDGTLRTLICDQDPHDINGDYNTSTGVFTCSVPGIYAFTCTYSISTTSSNTSNSFYSMMLVTNKSKYNMIQNLIAPSSASIPLSTFTVTTNANTYMVVGDTAYVQCAINAGSLIFGLNGLSGSTYGCMFSGKLLL